jgi:hypothetical protein
MTQARAVGVRTPNPAIPECVRARVSDALGSPVESWSEQTEARRVLGVAARRLDADLGARSARW